MNQAELNLVVEETVTSLQKLLRVKGGEYANSADRLANFKRGAALCGVLPLQVWFIYVSKHYDAIASYVKKVASGEQLELSEPIEGRLDDIIVYCTLAKAIIKEARGAEQAALDGGDYDQHGSRLYGQSLTDLLRTSPLRPRAVYEHKLGDNEPVHGVESNPVLQPTASVQLDSHTLPRISTKVGDPTKCKGCYSELVLPTSRPCCNCYNADWRS